MKKINSLRLLIVLMVVGLTVGCVKQHQGLAGSVAGGFQFEVDGVMYQGERYATIDAQGNVISSSLMIFLYTESLPIAGWVKDTPNQIRTMATWDADGEKIIAKTDTLYFFQGGRVIFEKTYQDLGINTQQFKADTRTLCNHLQPILEKLIRENITPQEEKE